MKDITISEIPEGATFRWGVDDTNYIKLSGRIFMESKVYRPEQTLSNFRLVARCQTCNAISEVSTEVSN